VAEIQDEDLIEDPLHVGKVILSEALGPVIPV